MIPGASRKCSTPSADGSGSRPDPEHVALGIHRVPAAPGAVEEALGALEADGLLLRGRFLDDAWSEAAPHFCERTALARIHRLTLGRLRAEIEPVSTADLVRFLLRWQHLAPRTQLHGARGLAEVIGQLQGFHAAAGAWEPHLLSARVAGYAPGSLKARLCVQGAQAMMRYCDEHGIPFNVCGKVVVATEEAELPPNPPPHPPMSPIVTAQAIPYNRARGTSRHSNPRRDRAAKWR